MKLGEILDKRYKIVDILGQGGTAQVLLAENIVLNNIWAVKVLPMDSQWISYQLEEVEILKGLSHPMLPRIVDLFKDNENFYIVMDYFSGSNLQDLVRKEGRISEKVLVKWTIELLEVLEYLHSRNPPVIYRDLKPANIIVDETGRLKLVDFGTARFHREGANEDTIYIGTQGYAAPEQYGAGRSDQRTDLFNLGMTLVNLSTGIHPLKIGTGKIDTFLRGVGVSKEFTKFISSLIEPNPENRFLDAQTALKTIKNSTKHRKQIFKKSPDKEIFNTFRGVIGITSYLPGNGATSLCLTLGRFLSGKGKRTALVELNNSGDFNRLGEILDDLGELRIKRETGFDAGDIVFYPDMTDSGEISRQGVDIVILDLGQLNSEQKLRELNRTDIKLILCPRAVWKYSLFTEYDDGIKSPSKNEWVYVADNSDSFERQILKKKFQHLVTYQLSKNPYYLTEDEYKNTERFFKEICLISVAKHD